MTGRVLIVNADDFGQSEGINRGIAEAHENGIVTSASLMVRWPAAAEAAAYARVRPGLSVGIHLDFGEWYLDGGEWRARYDVLAKEEPEEAAAEVLQQLAMFRELVGADPTHIDSHQHVHVAPHAREAALAAAAELDVPVRHLTPGISYCGGFYGQDSNGGPRPRAIGVDALTQLLKELPTGTSELACHPGYDAPSSTTYAAERATEVGTLCDPRIRGVLEEHGIELASFGAAVSADRL